MAKDTPILTTEDLNATAVAADLVTKHLGSLNDMVDVSKDILSGLGDKLSSITSKFDANGRMTENYATAFGLLTTEILGSRKAFDSLDGISSKGLHTFTEQWTNITNIISNSPIKDQAGIMGKALKQLGLDTGIVDDAAKGGVKGLSKLAASFLESADNGLRLQNTMVQLASRTGNLNDLTEAAGPHLENMNQLLERQQDAVNLASQATKNSTHDVQEYYAQLGKIPGALKATVAGTDDASSSVSMLTATIQFAKGSGRDYAAVVTDMHDAVKNYNLSTQDALKFTARMTEISGKFGVEFEDVQHSLRETSNLFKMFGNDTDGATRMMNNYLGVLKGTGLSGKNALDVINGMTQGIKGMSIAQKSFLSAQTGGPGGLMGGFQIEKMLKEGKIDEVMEKVRQQMKKQFGTIATLDDAASSQQGASQFNRQRMLLQQGPLGKFAQDDQSASKILEAFKARESGGQIKDLSKSIIQDTMKTGVDLQNKSVTPFDRARELIEAQQGIASTLNLSTMQNMFTAGTGGRSRSGNGLDPMAEMRYGINQSSEQAGRRSGEVDKNMDTKIIQDKGSTFAVQIIQDYKQFYDDLGPALRGPIDKIRSLFKSGDKSSAQKEYDDVLKTLQNKEEEAKNISNIATKEARIRQLNIQKQMVNGAYSTMETTGGNVEYKKLGISNNNSNDILSHEAVGRAINTVSKDGKKNIDTTSAAHTHQDGQANNQNITVRVEGYCLDCGQKMNNTAQARANTTAAHYGKG